MLLFLKSVSKTYLSSQGGLLDYLPHFEYSFQDPPEDIYWMEVKSGSHSSRVQLFATLWTIQSMEFSRPELLSG